MKPRKEYDLYGVFGYPLAHTLSPVMHEAAFRNKGLKDFYLALELSPKNFRKSMKSLKKFNLQGFNLTVPYKEAIIPYLHQVSAQAKAIGAVNTVFKKKNKWVGANTDVDGFLTSLKKDASFSPRGKKALVFGAGGAARAALYALASSKAKRITITNRTSKRAQQLMKEFKRLFPLTEFEVIALTSEKIKKTLKDVNLVVNTTSLGLKRNDKQLLKSAWIPKAMRGKKILFYDLIYHVKETPFLKVADAKKHNILNGLGMLLYQGASAFEIWTKKKAPVSLMRSQLKAQLAR